MTVPEFPSQSKIVSPRPTGTVHLGSRSSPLLRSAIARRRNIFGRIKKATLHCTARRLPHQIVFAGLIPRRARVSGVPSGSKISQCHIDFFLSHDLLQLSNNSSKRIPKKLDLRLLFLKDGRYFSFFFIAVEVMDDAALPHQSARASERVRE